MKLNCSWDDWAFVTARHMHALNQDRIVQCVRLATDDEERQLRAAGLDFVGTPGLAWEDQLWLVNVRMAWADREGWVTFHAFAPDACLRRMRWNPPKSTATEVTTA